MLPEGESRPYVIWSMLPTKSRESEPRRLKKNFGKAFKAILKKLGIEPWGKLFVNLRRSYRNDLERSVMSAKSGEITEKSSVKKCVKQGEKGAIRGVNEKHKPLVFKHQTQGVITENNQNRSGRTGSNIRKYK